MFLYNYNKFFYFFKSKSIYYNLLTYKKEIYAYWKSKVV